MEKKYENILFINGKHRQLSVSNAPAGISVTVIATRDNPCECESFTKVINHNDAIALTDAIYEAEGYGQLPYPENEPEEFGMYEVTLSKGIYRVKTDIWDGTSFILKNVIAFRNPRPYEGEVE